MPPIHPEDFLVVRRRDFSLEHWTWNADRERFDLARAYPIAIGQSAYRTKRGLYQITEKARNPSWTMPDSPWIEPELRGVTLVGDDPANPIKSRWLGFYQGAGIHGTDNVESLGTAASHGCIRMAVPDVEELYPTVPVGTVLAIH